MILTGMVQYGVRQVAESLQQMTSVERVLQYTELEQEAALNEKTPPPQWPTSGQVEFRSMNCRYDPNGSPVLKNLNLTIEAGWKVGIVGRTGAGKSSLIGALFRLAHIEGEILIDGIETGTISLETLRTRISIIPQDPVLFSATIRYNLIPSRGTQTPSCGVLWKMWSCVAPFPVWTIWSRNEAATSASARGSYCAWPERFSGTTRFWCWTKPQPMWIHSE